MEELGISNFNVCTGGKNNWMHWREKIQCAASRFRGSLDSLSDFWTARRVLIRILAYYCGYLRCFPFDRVRADLNQRPSHLSVLLTLTVIFQT
jgi:hypothetical protein